MRVRNNQYTLKDAINQLLRAYSLDGKLLEYVLVNSWEQIMGPMVARHTRDIFIKDKQLFIRLDSAPLRQELSYGKEKIVKALNENAGAYVIKDVVFQ